jgi:DEAD/DEAH box helicase domain-containing protein
LDKRAVKEIIKRLTGEGDFKVETEAPSVKTFQIKSSPKTISSFWGTIIFDLETQLSPEEVGGWKNIPDMLMAVGVVMEAESGKYRIFYDNDTDALIRLLKKAKLVVGFNLNRFDYKVLSHYGLNDTSDIETLDLLEEIERTIGFRLKLDNLCQATLNAQKSASGEKSLEWVKAGKLDLVTEYCQTDVKLTRDLYLFGKKNGYIFFKDKNGVKQKINVEW